MSTEYEFVFTDIFSDNVFTAYSGANQELKDAVTPVVKQLASILALKDGIHTISSFVNYNDKRFKITVINSSWKAPA